jgi:muramoyltetrapeptide carboxypeptidase LdcA involved in peptidoglycan recycling
MNHDYYKSMLVSAKEFRINEITEYQVNIDNYRLALELIGEEPDLQDFKSQIQELLTSNILEQKKAKIMYEVIVARLEQCAS